MELIFPFPSDGADAESTYCTARPLPHVGDIYDCRFGVAVLIVPPFDRDTFGQMAIAAGPVNMIWSQGSSSYAVYEDFKAASALFERLTANKVLASIVQVSRHCLLQRGAYVLVGLRDDSFQCTLALLPIGQCENRLVPEK